MACNDHDVNQSPFNVGESVFSTATTTAVAETKRSQVDFLGAGSSGPRRHGDFLNLFIPSDASFPSQTLKNCGYFNPAQAPWSVNTSGGGTAGTNTTQLNLAIREAYKNTQALYLPPAANILVNNTIVGIQGIYERTPTGTQEFSDRHGPIVIHGSRAPGGVRPRITLANSSAGFTSAGSPNRILHVWTRLNTDADVQGALSGFNNRINNVHIECGTGNAGAIGIEFNGAQGCSLSNASVNAAGAFAGAKVGLGSGAPIIALDTSAGQIGAQILTTGGFWDGSRPCPLLIACTFDHPTVRCIDYTGGNETLGFVGCRFLMTAAETMCLLRGISETSRQVFFIDCEFQFDSFDSTNICIDTSGSLYMFNCFARFAQQIFDGTDTGTLAGNPSGWMHIRELAHGRQPPVKPVEGTNYQFEQPNWRDGASIGYVDIVDVVNGVEPPADLQSRHMPEYHTFEDPLAVNVRDAPYNLIGNGDDEGAAINAAMAAIVAEGKKPFFGKGNWGTSVTINSPANCKGIMLDPQLSYFGRRDDAGGDFVVGASPTLPTFRTFNSVNDTTWWTNLGIHSPWGEGGFAWQWRSGRKSGAFPVNIHRFPSRGYGSTATSGAGPANNIVTAFDNRIVCEWTDAGGGRFYGIEMGEGSKTGVNFCFFGGTRTSEPLVFYGLNPEHAVNSNSQSRWRHVNNMTWFQCKAEGTDTGGGGIDTPPIWMENCDNIRVIGGGGFNASIPNTSSYPGGFVARAPSILRFDRVPRLKVAAYQVRGKKDGTPEANPGNTNFILDRQGQSVDVLTSVLHYPTLYTRGFGAPWREPIYPLQVQAVDAVQLFNFVLEPGVTGTVRITKAFGAVPKLLEVWCGQAGPGHDAMIMYGACVPGGFRQASHCSRSVDGVTTTNTDAGFRDDSAILVSSGNSTEEARATVTAIDAEGITLNVITAPTQSLRFQASVLIGDNILADVVAFTLAGTAPFTQDITTLDFGGEAPKGYKICSAQIGLANGVASQARFTHGWTDGILSQCTGLFSLDGVTSLSDTQGFQRTAGVLHHRVNAGLAFTDQVGHNAFLPNGFRLSATLLEASRRMFAVAIGGTDVSIECVDFLQPDIISTQPIPGAPDPAGIWFLSQAKQGNSNATGNSRVMLGCASPADQYSAAFSDTDALNLASGSQTASDFDLERGIILVDGASPTRRAQGTVTPDMNNIDWFITEVTARQVLAFKIFVTPSQIPIPPEGWKSQSVFMLSRPRMSASGMVPRP